MKRFVFLPFIILLLASPIREANVFGNIDAGPAPAPAVAATTPPLRAVEEYKELLKTRGQNLDAQGILVQTLDTQTTLAEHNSDIAFNPASVMKLATTLTALAKFGPDYRYRTNFLADGAIEANARKLNGDLVVEGVADPMFSAQDAQEVAAELSKLGVGHVSGALRIAGPFYYFATGYHSNLSRETSAAKLRTALQAAGIRIEGATVFGEKSGTVLVSHYSEPLLHILFYQNAHSSNAIAEVVGESVGGPQAVQAFLTKQVGLRDGDIYVGRTSGLEFNRITPRAALQVLRGLIGLLANYSLKPDDVMPVGGVDSGTLRARFVSDAARGAVVAKTGTLVSLDNGVSTLVGIAYTKSGGPLLFAVLNSDGGVHSYRRLQDEFIERLIAEEGGPAPVARNEDALADTTRHTIVQVLYNSRIQPPADTAAD